MIFLVLHGLINHNMIGCYMQLENLYVMIWNFEVTFYVNDLWIDLFIWNLIEYWTTFFFFLSLHWCIPLHLNEVKEYPFENQRLCQTKNVCLFNYWVFSFLFNNLVIWLRTSRYYYVVSSFCSCFFFQLHNLIFLVKLTRVFFIADTQPAALPFFYRY